MCIIENDCKYYNKTYWGIPLPFTSSLDILNKVLNEKPDFIAYKSFGTRLLPKELLNNGYYDIPCENIEFYTLNGEIPDVKFLSYLTDIYGTIIVIGCFTYSISIPLSENDYYGYDPDDQSKRITIESEMEDLYRKYDSLYYNINNNFLPLYFEGVNNSGPRFKPIVKDNILLWDRRILYKGNDIKCLDYNGSNEYIYSIFIID